MQTCDLRPITNVKLINQVWSDFFNSLMKLRGTKCFDIPWTKLMRLGVPKLSSDDSNFDSNKFRWQLQCDSDSKDDFELMISKFN